MQQVSAATIATSTTRNGMKTHIVIVATLVLFARFVTTTISKHGRSIARASRVAKAEATRLSSSC